MADSELSSSTDDEQPPALTPAQKAKITRAANLRRQQEEEEATAKELGWDPTLAEKDDEDTNAVEQPGRKRAASAGGGQPAKRAKPKAAAESEMDVDVEVVLRPKPKPANRQGAQKKSETVEAPEQRRQYAPPQISDDDDAAPAPLYKPSKRTNPVPAVKPKKKVTATTSEDDDAVDGAASQEEEEDDGKDVSQSQSSEDEGMQDIDAEQPRLVRKGPENDGLLDFDSDDNVPIPKLPTRRQSTSSFGSMPPDTDLDDIHADQSDPEIDDGEERFPSPEPEPEPVKPKQKKKQMSSAQQAKYDKEVPTVRKKNVVNEQPTANDPEPVWHTSTHIVFPKTGGPLKLRDQKDIVGKVLKGGFDLYVFEIGYNRAYDTAASRAEFASRVLRICAKKLPNNQGYHIAKRAKKDDKYCALLAPLICARGGNLRTDVRNVALSIVATLYELNKPGIGPPQVRGIIRQLLDKQAYIFPYGADVAAEPVTITNADIFDDPASAPADGTISKKGKATKIVKTFDQKAPFLAPAFPAIIHDVWWSGKKALGPKHLDKLVSHNAHRPSEVVLPDAMICLVGANIWAALQAYSTGVFVNPPEFNQARLESTYNSLLDTIKAQREGPSAKKFNGVMHQLYLKASQSSHSVAASSSAPAVILLDTDSD